MPLVSAFVHRFFELPRSRSRFAFETNVALEIVHVNEQQSLMIVGRPCALSFRELDFFFPFFFRFSRLVNLEPRSKFQRASRPKEEDRRGLDKLSRRGAATNDFPSFGSCLGSKDGRLLLLFCHCARFST